MMNCHKRHECEWQTIRGAKSQAKGATIHHLGSDCLAEVSKDREKAESLLS